MLDPFIAEKLFVPPPPTMASPAIERSWDYAEIAALERDTDAWFDARSALLASWLTRIDAIARDADAWSKDVVGHVTQEDIGSLDRLIEDLERHAREGAIQVGRFNKKNERALKRATNMSAERRAMMKRIMAKGHEIDERQIRGFLDFAWMVRAIRADVVPDAGTGRTFDRPEDLERHLATIV